MAVDLNKVKRELNDINRAEDRALASLQRYFEKNNSHKPSRTISITTELSAGGYAKPISTTQINLNAAGEVIGQPIETIQQRSLVHKHNIEWADIERSYKLQEAIHSLLALEYLKEGKIYKGRSLYQQADFKQMIDAAGRIRIDGQGSKVIKPWTPFGRSGRYGKLDVDIHKRVLDKIYSQVWQETNKHLLDKFNTIDLSGSGDFFNKLIKGTQELIYDIKKVKEWSKEVESIVNQAELKYKAKIKQEQRAVTEAQKKYLRSQHILTIEQLEIIGKAILGLAIEYCPIETGRLRSSGKLYVSNQSIRIIFECEYAAYVHDNPNAQHPVGRYHYLVDAAQDILPKISVWTEVTGNDAFVLGDYMKQTWDKDSAGNITSDMYWSEHKGYQAVYIDIDTDLKINYAHYK